MGHLEIHSVWTKPKLTLNIVKVIILTLERALLSDGGSSSPTVSN